MGKCVRYGVINGCDESLVKCVLNYSMYLLQCYLWLFNRVICQFGDVYY